MAEITAEYAGPDSDHGDTGGGRARLWEPLYRPVVVVGLVLVFVGVFSGESMVAFYAPTILEQIGFTNTAVAFATTLGLAVISFIATLIALAVVDQHRRKRMMVTGLFVLAAALLTMAVLTVAPQETTVVRWGQVACLAVFVAAFWLTVGPVSGIVINEIYPQAIRGRAISLTSVLHGVFAIVFTLTFPMLLQGVGLAITLTVYAVIGIAGALYLIRALPETKAKSLEEITQLWNQRAAARRSAKVSVP